MRRTRKCSTNIPTAHRRRSFRISIPPICQSHGMDVKFVAYCVLRLRLAYPKFVGLLDCWLPETKSDPKHATRHRNLCTGSNRQIIQSVAVAGFSQHSWSSDSIGDINNRSRSGNQQLPTTHRRRLLLQTRSKAAAAFGSRSRCDGVLRARGAVVDECVAWPPNNVLIVHTDTLLLPFT